MRKPIARMICKGADKVCLNGGCGYCSGAYGRWKSIDVIRAYAERTDQLSAFNWGLTNDFANAQVKYDNGQFKFEGGHRTIDSGSLVS
jgi:hypothetical protein